MPVTSIFGSRAVDAQEVELTAAPDTTSALVAEAAAQDAKTNFEWNVGRLYSSEPDKSTARTWIVRILSTLLVFPLVLTAIVDLGRRLAYSVGLVNGESFSLIDKASAGCKVIADKVNSVYQSYCKPLTKEELNAKSQAAIKAHSEKLVGGFQALNGGYFHTNSSFSSPAALKAEKQIEKAKEDLIAEVNSYVVRNATDTENFADHLIAAKTMVASSLAEAAGDAPYIENKSTRQGPRPFIRDWANVEFQAALEGNKQTVEQFVGFAKQEPDFAAGLKKGVEAGVLTNRQAKVALKQQVEAVYSQGLVTGLKAANIGAKSLLESGVKVQIVNAEEVAYINESIPEPDVDVLANAAARDVARKQQANPAMTQDEITVQLTKAADGLKRKKKLNPENETRFLTAAKAQLAKAKEAVEAETLKQKQVADELAAKQVAEVQKAADQSSLLGQFVGMLGLISKKQEGLRAQFLKFDELEAKRQTVTDSLEAIQEATVTVRDAGMTVFQAAGEYYKAVRTISNSSLTPTEKNRQIKGLANQGFSQQTIDKINQLKALELQLTEVLGQQEALAQAIDTQHEEVATLMAKFRVYEKNNAAQLEARNRTVVTDTRKRIEMVQKTLDQRHKPFAPGNTSLIDRLRSEPHRGVNTDPATNRGEIENLVKAFEKPQAPESVVKEEIPVNVCEKPPAFEAEIPVDVCERPPAFEEETLVSVCEEPPAPKGIFVPTAIPRTTIVWNGVKDAFSFLATPAIYPIGVLAKLWNRPKA